MTAAYPYTGDPRIVTSLLTAMAIGFTHADLPYQSTHASEQLTPLNPFVASLGIEVVPVSRETKSPYHADWPTRRFSLADFRPNDNVGGLWGDRSGGLIDIDCDTGYACRIGERFFKTGPRYGRRGKPYSHYIARSRGAKTKRFINPITKTTVIELRSTGAQSVLPPSVHPSGERYEWERQEPPIDIDPTDLTRHVGIVAACSFVASLWTDSRHNFALALAGFLATHDVSADFARELVGLIAHGAADEEAPDRFRAVEDTYRRFSNGEDVAWSFADLLGDNAVVFVKTIIDWLQLRQSQFHIRSEAALLARPAAQFLAKGLLVDGSLVALVSRPDVGKTFLALDLVLSIAARKNSWLNQRVMRHGPVLYVIGEGAGRFKLRVLAWKNVHDVRESLPFYWVDEPVRLVDDKHARAFITEAAPLRPVAVVFDTLSRCLMGADENSQADMGKAVAVCDELRARTSAMVMLIHHTRKDGTVERGSSVLRGAVDTVLLLEEKERGLITLTCDRQKDAEPFAPISLVRRSIRLAEALTDDGQPESSCVIQAASARDVDALKNTRDERLLDLIRKEPGATKTWLSSKVGGNKKRLLDQIDELEQRGVLRFVSDGRAQRVFLNDLYTRA